MSDEERLAYLISIGKVRPALKPGPIEFGPPFQRRPGTRPVLESFLEERHAEDED